MTLCPRWVVPEGLGESLLATAVDVAHSGRYIPPAGLGNKLEADALTSRTLEREVPSGTIGVGQIFEWKLLRPLRLGGLEQT